jgi:hypothetical protein
MSWMMFRYILIEDVHSANLKSVKSNYQKAPLYVSVVHAARGARLMSNVTSAHTRQHLITVIKRIVQCACVRGAVGHDAGRCSVGW